MPRLIYCLLALVALTTVPWAGAVSAQQQDLPRPTVRQAPPVETLTGFVSNRAQRDDEEFYFACENGIEATLTRNAIIHVSAAGILRRHRPCEMPPDGEGLRRAGTSASSWMRRTEAS